MRVACARLLLLGLLASCVPEGAQEAQTNDAGPVVDAFVKLDAPPAKVTSVPTTRPELDQFLTEERYLDFASESGLHQSEGSHFGRVITFMNPALVASLKAGNREHPVGAAAVKELYKGGQTLVGWAVIVKVAPRSNGGEGYFWFETDGGRVLASGVGQPVCAQCHAMGNDFILTTFPLR
jgi:hypothetical protein